MQKYSVSTPCWIQISAPKLKWLCRDLSPNWVQEITVMTTALMGPEWQCKSRLYGEHGRGNSLVTVCNASSYMTANMIWTANINIKISQYIHVMCIPTNQYAGNYLLLQPFWSLLIHDVVLDYHLFIIHWHYPLSTANALSTSESNDNKYCIFD